MEARWRALKEQHPDSQAWRVLREAWLQRLRAEVEALRSADARLQELQELSQERLRICREMEAEAEAAAAATAEAVGAAAARVAHLVHLQARASEP
jgi:hypothetical protein